MSTATRIEVGSWLETINTGAALTVLGRTETKPVDRLCLCIRTGCVSMDISMLPAECLELVAALTAAAAEFDAGQEVT